MFLKKYALRDTRGQIVELTLGEAKDRWARAIAQGELSFSGEHKPEAYFRELYERFLPAGRQMCQSIGVNRFLRAGLGQQLLRL
mgnify:CR=1 FL=1